MRVNFRAVVLALTLLASVAAAQACPNPDVVGNDPPGHLLTTSGRAQIFDALVNLMRTRAVDPTFGGRDWATPSVRARASALAAPDDRAFYQAVRAFANDLGDDHLEFLSPADVRNEEADASGDTAYGGIGVTGRGDDRGRLVIETVRLGGPAALAGLREGDALMAVDGACPTVEKVRGPVGTRVRLHVVGGNGAQRDLTLTRAEFGAGADVLTARLRIAPDVGYLRFDSFDVDGIGAQVQSALYLLTKGAPLRGLIIDLRANGGGQLYEMGRFLGLFVSGEVGEDRDRDGEALPVVIRKGYGEAVDRLRGVPLSVLVSAHTASAAEKAAAILRAFAGAKVLGQTTARLLTAASVVPLPFGAEAHVPTTDFFLAGKGRLSETGVVPDVSLAVTPPALPDDDPAVRRALQELSGR